MIPISDDKGQRNDISTRSLWLLLRYDKFFAWGISLTEYIAHDNVQPIPPAKRFFHYDTTMFVSRPRRPELPGTHQALVVGQHDDDLGIMVPDHSPEVGGGVGQRMLGNDELITPEVTLGGRQKVSR